MAVSNPTPAIESERRFESLVHAVRDYAIFMLDAQGRVQSWNLGARAIKGYAPEEIIGRSFETFYTPEDRASGHPQELLARAREDGRVEELGWRVRKDGSRFFADVVITALRDERGELIGYGKVTRDLTEKRLEDERRFAHEQRFRHLVEAVRDYAIFMLDATGRVATWNTGATRIIGYTLDEIVGAHLSVFYPQDRRDRGDPERELTTALMQGRFEEEGVRLRKDGSEFWANVVLTPIHGSDGTHLGFVKVTRDLTERRNAELERERLVQAQEAIRLRDEFLSIASHELRTPLTALQLQLESVQRLIHGTDDKLEHRIERAEKSAKRLAELVDALLDVSRIASGRMTMHPCTVDLADVVHEIVERMQEVAARAHITFTSSIERGLVIGGDPLRVGQVLSNLLSNAFRYASGTSVDVTLRKDGRCGLITVRDHGPGVPPDALERIFGRFERASDQRHYGGLGLGLYLAREIVAAHGGTIEAHNAHEGGAVFTVGLPLQGEG